MTSTYKLCTDTHLQLFHSEYQFTESRIPLTYECPNHVSVRHIKFSWIKFSLTVIWIAIKRADCYRHYQAPQSCRPSWKRSLSNVTNNENITYTFIAYRTQRSILFCCTETNNILRAVLSNEDAVFSMRTFTWSWWLPVSLCRSTIGLDIEPYGLHAWHNLRHARLPALTFEADIFTRWKGILVKWFSEPFFHLFLRISTIDIVILIHIINLSHQIIEFSEDRDHRYWKMLDWGLELKWRVIERNLSQLSLSQRRPLPVAIEAEHCSEQYKTFTKELIIRGYYVRRDSKTDQIACSWSCTSFDLAFCSINDKTSCSCFSSPVSNPGESWKIKRGLLLNANGRLISCMPRWYVGVKTIIDIYSKWNTAEVGSS